MRKTMNRRWNVLFAVAGLLSLFPTLASSSISTAETAATALIDAVNLVSLMKDIDFYSAMDMISKQREDLAREHGVSVKSLISEHHRIVKRGLDISRQCDSFGTPYNFSLDYSNWMENYENSAVQRLFDITLPGSHDAAAYKLFLNFNENDPDYKPIKPFIDKGFPESTVAQFACKYAVTQNADISQQLKAGIRYFDIRASLDENSEWKAFHILYGVPIHDVLEQFKVFLDQNTKEIVFIEISHMYGEETRATRVELLAMIQKAFGNMLYPNTLSFTETIQDMQAKGYNVVISMEDKDIVSMSNGLLWDSNVIKNTYAQTTDVDAMVLFNDEKIQEFLAEVDVKLYKISWTLTPDEDYISSTILDSKATLFNLASSVNGLISAFVDKHRKAGVAQFGQTLLYDYIGNGVDVVQVLQLGTAKQTDTGDTGDTGSNGTTGSIGGGIDLDVTPDPSPGEMDAKDDDSSAAGSCSHTASKIALTWVLAMTVVLEYKYI